MFEIDTPTLLTAVKQCIKDVQNLNFCGRGAPNTCRSADYHKFVFILKSFKLKMVDSSDSKVNKAGFMIT